MGHPPLALRSPRGEVQRWYSSGVSVLRHEQGEEKGPATRPGSEVTEMRERHTWNLDQLSRKCASYWQSVLRFGLPFIILYRGTNYVAFRITAGDVGLPYPWRSVAIPDVAYMFLASTIWWALMRWLVTMKQKDQQK